MKTTFLILTLAVAGSWAFAGTGSDDTVKVMKLEVTSIMPLAEPEEVTVMPPVNTYTMICKAGKGMSAVFKNRSYNGRMNGRAYLSVVGSFKKGKVAGEPRSGECTWMDRGMRQGEPKKFLFETNNWRQKFRIVDGKLSIDKGPISYLANRMRQKRKFKIQVYNVKDRYFRVVYLNP